MRAVGDSGKVPAAKKESHDHGGTGDHGGVFAEEKKRELHRSVFDVVAAGQLLLGLR